MIITANLQQLCGIVQDGGIIAYPTEAVFGLGCDPYNKDAIENLISLKERNKDKGFIVVAAIFSQIEDFLCSSTELPEEFKQPSEHTYIIPTSATVEPSLSGKHAGLAIRISKHPAVIDLCNALDSAIVSTSANISGLEPAKTVFQIAEQFADSELSAVYDAKLGDRKNPSNIFDAITGKKLR